MYQLTYFYRLFYFADIVVSLLMIDQQFIYALVEHVEGIVYDQHFQSVRTMFHEVGHSSLASTVLRILWCQVQILLYAEVAILILLLLDVFVVRWGLVVSVGE